MADEFYSNLTIFKPPCVHPSTDCPLWLCLGLFSARRIVVQDRDRCIVVGVTFRGALAVERGRESVNIVVLPLYQWNTCWHLTFWVTATNRYNPRQRRWHDEVRCTCGEKEFWDSYNRDVCTSRVGQEAEIIFKWDYSAPFFFVFCNILTGVPEKNMHTTTSCHMQICFFLPSMPDWGIGVCTISRRNIIWKSWKEIVLVLIRALYGTVQPIPYGTVGFLVIVSE